MFRPPRKVGRCFVSATTQLIRAAVASRLRARSPHFRVESTTGYRSIRREFHLPGDVVRVHLVLARTRLSDKPCMPISNFVVLLFSYREGHWRDGDLLVWVVVVVQN
jgi:hypothetical protein